MQTNNIILFDNDARERLLPLTYTRPVCELRVGILTIREKWERHLEGEASYITQDYLSDKYDIKIAELNYIINGSVLPSDELATIVKGLRVNQALLYNEELIAAKLDKTQFEYLMDKDEAEEMEGFDLQDIPFLKINDLHDIFSLNDAAIKDDFKLLTKGRKSQPISDTNNVIAPENIFIEEGASVEYSTLNASTGPIYIGKNAQIMEGCLIRGGLAMCENSILKMGAKIYGATTLGPWCKVGGEVNNSVLFAYSNKGHEGFLGNSVLGEWCNIGAGTNSSNLKNNYAEVKLWNYATERFEPTGKQFCGLVFGDHTKCGINTMFNTGTVIGVSANVYGSGFPRNFIPSFAWGSAAGMTTYRTAKAFETAERVMERRGIELTPEERLILLRVFEDSAKFRRWENKA
ncbi:MAG: UDP-N-acetylglucosamine diphosphorylase/glucosamine-1-phosphate N-acetyltransferase [Saprospiraceae bacterium]|jgi:UDP-N-acetylglucosamine diphosphorylase/glucosamine-1-phosphate N-acetyltransferase